MPVVRLLSTDALAHPDEETPLVVTALAERGADASIVAWDDASVDWTGVDAAVIRTTWDYDSRHAEFMAFVRSVSRQTRLFNPAAVVEWNSHKSYLAALAARGAPVVPTRVVAAGDDPAEALGDGPVVVKPAISAGARLTARFESGADPAAAAHVSVVHRARGDALVQPFLPAILESGERSLVYLGGELSHALNKRGAPGEYRIQAVHGGRVEDHVPTEAELAAAEAVLAAAGAGLLYARVDLVDGADGPMLMELEAIEPQLFLDRAPGSADRLAELILAACDGPREQVPPPSSPN